MSYREMVTEVKIGLDPGDAWGSAMGTFFDLTAELWGRDDATIPDEWSYSPGAMGGDPREADSWLYELFAQADTADLERFGAVLHRWTDMLRAADRDY